ncbi:GNAT family N-acetyltransferase [Guptibacillus algicola]|uniref:GNAT family N-acetyltransferase n=1 Tax=Guptibacillus algicola TaxID=225844 RepID=UPI001CD76988|nr:GNAT family N-acetyltransferase [Alkalihalobacillus algicola]MCA0987343.1 GNAT family N-acetyltransferase [Alkalihalobacillus algicola]
MIREMTTEDLPVLVGIYKETFLASHKGFLPRALLETVTDQTVLDRFHRIFGSEVRRPFCFVKEIDNSAIGFVLGTFALNPPKGYKGEIKMLYVLPEYQQSGVGKQLLQKAVQHFINHNVETMFIGTFKDNTVGRGFYERLDGEVISEQTDVIHGHPLVTVNYGWSSIGTIFDEPFYDN